MLKLSQFTRLFLISLGLAGLAACGTPAATAPTAAPAETPAVSGYPAGGAPVAPTEAPPTGYPAGQSDATDIPDPTVTANPALGRVTGVLLWQGQPVVGYMIAAGQLIKGATPQENVVAYDPVTSPTATTSADGSFEIRNVPDGDYGLVLLTFQDGYHLLYPDRNESVLLTVAGASVIDLGVLDYQDLPIKKAP